VSLRYKIGVSKDHAQVTANWDISVDRSSDSCLTRLREDKCEQCKAVVQYFDREAEIELYLRNSRN
jgi:hypothetical protein